jgi:5-methylcytosine-specific restriction enzyme B
MNTDQRQQLWDRFLAEWPVERIEAMTLAEYVSVEDKSTFTYWLETEARELGSIKGGSSEKFGIYKRADSSKRNGRNNYRHDDTYTWHSKHGEDASAAFANIKQNILAVIKAVRANDLNAIEVIDVAPTLKWKVAFIYQNRVKPSVLNIYKASVLCRAVKNSQATMAQAYSQLLDNKPDDTPLFDYYAGVWASNQAASEQEIEQLIESMNMDAVNSLSKTKLQQLYELTEWAHDAGLDIYPVNIDNQFRIGRKSLDNAKLDAAFKLVTVQKSKIKLGDAKYNLEYLATCEEEKDKFAEQYLVDREGYWPVDYVPNNTSTETAKSNNGDRKMTMQSLNQILYGPPGTGKTHHTIEAAVKAAEPEFAWKTRGELKAKYDELVMAKRIRFVTFHQSYGYEEFVEGLKAKTTEEKSIEYIVENGVFKAIVEDAKSSDLRKAFEVNTDATIWKISIDGTGQSEVSNYCLANGLAAIGWGEAGDLRFEGLDSNDYYQGLGPQVKSSLFEFSQRATAGDLILCIGSQRTVQAVGVITGDYHFEQIGTSEYDHYCNQLPVNWLVTDIDVDFHELNGGVNFTQKTFYELWRFSVSDVFDLLKRQGIDVNPVKAEQEVENYVLIIDEINRGNISRIFGELITLIEPSKRAGKRESLSLTLPYSGKPFSVPDNLYIIGTMNTADRSLAMMDTALRRRFDFKEMMPNASMLAGCEVNGINLEALLSTLNERIEVLYDREHTLGHAFFIPVKDCIDKGDEENGFNELVSVFQNKILPLLQEYFFDDWDKIRLVLGDNQRGSAHQLIEEQTLNGTTLSQLFGSEHNLDPYGEGIKQYKLKAFDDDIWQDPNVYISMYDNAIKGKNNEPASEEINQQAQA